MMASSLPSFAPPHAIKLWVDPTSLYFELAGVNGPTVIAFPRNSIGFAKALAVLFAAQPTESAGTPFTRPELESPPAADGTTFAQRLAARDILRKMKII